MVYVLRLCLFNKTSVRIFMRRSHVLHLNINSFFSISTSTLTIEYIINTKNPIANNVLLETEKKRVNQYEKLFELRAWLAWILLCLKRRRKKEKS